jgi:hypothetical protein
MGIVLANNIPKSNEFGFGDDMVIDGSTYAIGKLTPDAFSILLIPEITIGKRLRINEYFSLGKIPLLYASFTFNKGSIKKKIVNGIKNVIFSNKNYFYGNI